MVKINTKFMQFGEFKWSNFMVRYALRILKWVHTYSSFPCEYGSVLSSYSSFVYIIEKILLNRCYDNNSYIAILILLVLSSVMWCMINYYLHTFCEWVWKTISTTKHLIYWPIINICIVFVNEFENDFNIQTYNLLTIIITITMVLVALSSLKRLFTVFLRQIEMVC